MRIRDYDGKANKSDFIFVCVFMCETHITHIENPDVIHLFVGAQPDVPDKELKYTQQNTADQRYIY